MRRKKLLIIFLSLILVLYSSTCFALDAESLHAQAVVIIDADSGKVLFEKNMDQKMFPASTTKIMTAILAIENCNLDDKVTVNYDALSTIPSGYTSAGLVVGEELTVKQLLEVLLVHSANDSANVLAMHVGGSVESFITMMNSKAKELHCDNTNFTNTYGLHDENHYSTAKDLAIMTKYCMKNSTFRHFVAQQNCQIPPTNKHEARYFDNTNRLILPSSPHYYQYAIGVKTGYTKEAGNCLIGASKKDDFETIAVVLNTGTIAGARCDDAIELFNYAYENFAVKKIASKGDVVTNVDVFNGSPETKNINLILSEDITVLNEASNNIDIKPEINLNKNISAPLAKGAEVGTVTYDVLGIKYTSKLVAEHDVEKSDALFFWLCAGLAVVILIIILIVVYMIVSKNKRKNYSRDFYGI